MAAPLASSSKSQRSCCFSLRNIMAGIGAALSTALPIALALGIGLGDPPSYITQDVYQLPSGRFVAVSDVARNWTASVACESQIFVACAVLFWARLSSACCDSDCESRGMQIASLHSQADADSLEWLIQAIRR